MNYPDHLREIFDKLKNGYHISPEDDAIYAALNSERYDDYADYFTGLGFTLHKHEHDFFYFEPETEDNASPRLAKIAVFSFILIDHIANRGLPVEPTLFTETFTIRGLPHYTLDSYRARLEQVGIMDYADLKDVVHHLKNVGWAKWIGEDEFRFLRPFHRMLSKCLELAEQSGKAASETSPIQEAGLNPGMTALLNEIGSKLNGYGFTPTGFAISVVSNTSDNTDILLADILLSLPWDATQAYTDLPELGAWLAASEFAMSGTYDTVTPSPLDIVNTEYNGIVFALNQEQKSLMTEYGGCWQPEEQVVNPIPYVVECGQELKIVVSFIMPSASQNSTSIDLSCILGNFAYGFTPCYFTPGPTTCGGTSGEYVPIQETYFFQSTQGNAIGIKSAYVEDDMGNKIPSITVDTPTLANPCTVSITTSSSSGIEGMVSGPQAVLAGTTVTVSATNNPGYTFLNWTENGFIVTNSPNYTFTANNSLNLMANFVPSAATKEQWTETSAPTTSDWGSLASSADGTKLVAAANNGIIYVSTDSGTTWTSVLSNNVLDSVASSADGTKLVAGSVTGNGRVYTSADSGVSWIQSSAPTTNYWWRSVASSADGSRFVAASFYNSSTKGGIYVSTNSGTTWTKTSAPTNYSWLSVASSADGTKLVAVAVVFFNPGGIYISTNSGTTWAQAGAPSNFVWDSVASSADGTKLLAANNGGGIYTSTNSGTTWTQTSAPNEAWHSVASSADGFKLVAAAGGVNGVIYTSSDSGTTWTQQTNTSSIYWASVASSADGTKLVAASDGSGTGGGIYTFQTAPTTTWTITMTASPATGGSTSSSGIVNSGSSVTVTAMPSACYSFTNWTVNGTVVSTSSTYTFTTNENINLVAHFVPTTYSISVGNSSGGTVSGGGQVNCASSVTVTASASASYQFVDWTENGNFVSASPSYTFTPSASGTLFANFLPVTYVINTGSSPANGGSTSGGGIFNSGSSARLTATANPGYTFLNWTENGAVVNSSSNYTFTVTGNQALVANFVPNIPVLGFGSPLWSASGLGLLLQGPIGSNYEIDVSTDLLTWLPFTNFSLTSSPFFFSVPPATNANQGFFRAKMQ